MTVALKLLCGHVSLGPEAPARRRVSIEVERGADASDEGE